MMAAEARVPIWRMDAKELAERANQERYCAQFWAASGDQDTADTHARLADLCEKRIEQMNKKE